MKALLQKLAALAGQPSATLGSWDPEPLFAHNSFELSPTVAEYFSSCVPSVRLPLDFSSIFATKDLLEQNRGFVPSYYCVRHGFITIATMRNGDAFSVDVRDGKVYVLSHEKYEKDGIHPGWNEGCTAFLPVLPVTRQNIIETSDGYWDSIPEFLEECLAQAEDNV